MTNYKQQVSALLKSIETGDASAIACINPTKYIQHNLGVADGLAGFGEVLHALPKGSAKANVVRVFQDGDFVFSHTEYDFFGPKIGFDIFRFEDGKIVEHWDNLIAVQVKNPSARTQTDGATELKDLDKTAANKALVQKFVDDILLNHKHNFTDFISATEYAQHNPSVADGLEGFGAAMKYFAEQGLVMEYHKLHQIHAEGNFVLTVCEGKFGKGEATSFYDLFRVADGKIVEHWDVIEPIAPQSEWKNTNGKF
jgi:predicted SnoaL-like aldol condensation-catalyzing enzyme